MKDKMTSPLRLTRFPFNMLIIRSVVILIFTCDNAVSGAEFLGFSWHYSIFTDDTISDDAFERQHLQRDVIPQSYNLKIQFNLPDGDQRLPFFNGSVTIKLYCLNATKVITLHAGDNLRVSSRQVTISTWNNINGNPKKVEIKRISRIRDTDQYRIELQSPLKPNTHYNLTIGRFRLRRGRAPEGLYLTDYVTNDTRSYIVTTGTEPTHSRRLFPCWDEPTFKAQFQVNIIRHKDYNSLSNMPLNKTETLYGDWCLDSYEPSENISAHLLTIVISQLSPKQITDSKGRNFTFWGSQEALQFANNVLNISARLIEFFENYFSVPYPVKKLDIVAIPDLDYKWFGNIVTMKWWDNVWVNEGLATFFEYAGLSHIHPKWKVTDNFPLDVTQKALYFDSSLTSLPLSQKIIYPEEVENDFGIYSYDKAASLLRMVQSFVGHKAFLDGVKNYLIEHKYDTADDEDLWEALEKAAKEENKCANITKVMDTWTRQINYPLVVIKRDDTNTFHFSQIPYFDPSNDTEPSEHHNYTWEIPLTYGSANTTNWDETRVIWMTNRTMTKTLDIKPTSWYLFNVQQTGYYRVNYTDNNWQLLTEQLNKDFEAIPVASRSQIINDLFNLANKNNVSYTVFLNLTKYLKNENNSVVWETVLQPFNFLYHMLGLTESYTHFQAYQQSLLDKPLESVDWVTIKEDQDFEKGLRREYLVHLACQVEHPLCVRNATELYNQWVINPSINPIPRSLRRTVYCSAIRSGNATHWEFLRQRLSVKGNDHEEMYNILQGLSCSSNVETMKKYSNWILQNEDLQYVLSDIASSPTGNQVLCQSAIDELKSVVNGSKTTQQGPKIQRLVELLDTLSEYGDVLIDVAKQAEIIELGRRAIESSRIPILQTIYATYLQRVEKNLKWLNTYDEVINSWLKENFGKQ
uniref:Aminopeptidase n=1 Tax=Trichobilharzia regenti TaxID=157069 RepID=A0AA85JWF7_TRIRE|nr:unnamed protein product [Trichobilharzia regenti]